MKNNIIVLLFLISSWCLGQTPFQFKQIKDNEGLLGNHVNGFLQDKDGFLWIGTYDGLKRYSGAHTNVFRTNRHDSTSICDNVVHKMCEDKTGRIWFGTNNGVAIFDKQTNRFKNIRNYNNVPLTGCMNILLGMDGNIWFSSYWEGLFRYDIEKDKLEKIGQPADGIVQNGLVEDKWNKGIWIGTKAGMYFYDYQTKTLQNYSKNPQKFAILTSNEAVALTLDKNHLIFADNNKSAIVFFDLIKKKITKEIKVESKIKQPYFDAGTVFVDQYHHLWVSTWNYLTFYIEPENNKVTQLFHDKTKTTSIAAEFFWHGWQQNDGSIWLGTGNGISILNPSRSFYKVYDISQVYPAVDEEFGIRSFAEDKSDGSWWLGSFSRGLIHYFPKTNTFKVFKLPNKTNLLPYGGVVKNLQGYGNNLYFISGDALFSFDKRTEKFKKLSYKKPVERNLKLQNDKLWVVFKDKSVASFHVPSGVWKEYDLSNLFLDKSHELGYPFVDYLGRYGILSDREGIFYYNSQKDEFEALRTKKGKEIKFSTFHSFVSADQLGNLWLYGKDLVKINLKTLDAKTVYETERIGHAVIDDKENHWLNLYNRYTFFNSKSNQTKQFDLPIGVDNTKYYTSIFKLSNGHILSCQKSNLIEFMPEKLNLESPIGNLLLDKIDLIDSTFLLHHDASKIKLKEDKSTFTIAHGIINQYDETKYRFYYQLKGNSDDWIETNSSSTTFTNLAGGDYTYSLKAINADGKTTATRTLFIHLDTVFYKTAWFRLIFGLAIVLVGFSFFRYRINQRKKIHHLQIQSTRLEKDKTEIQYQNLINHLNPHFLFNSLTSLNGLILSEPDVASDFLQKLSKIYRYILQNKDNEVVSLEQELAFVKNYVDLQKSRFEEGLQLNINIDDQYLSKEIVPVTLQNLFENAIKHNTIEEEKPLIITVFIENEYLIVKNTLQKKKFVETSNKQGLESLKSLYKYLTHKPLETFESASEFVVRVPLL